MFNFSFCCICCSWLYCLCVSCSNVIYCCVFVLCLCVICVTCLLYCCTTATGLKPNCILTNIYIYTKAEIESEKMPWIYAGISVIVFSFLFQRKRQLFGTKMKTLQIQEP
jgi:hypothetical protein